MQMFDEKIAMEILAERILTVYPHQHSITNSTYQHWAKVYAWCVDQFGPTGGRWMAFMANRNDFKLRFKTENDLSWFLLRWA